MSEERNESSFSFESPQPHSSRPSSSTLVLDSTPAPQTSALAKAEEIAAFWNRKVEEAQERCMRIVAKGHDGSSASADDQQEYQAARADGREYAAQHAEAVARITLLRNQFLPTVSGGSLTTAQTTALATPVTPAAAATPTVSRPVRYDQYPQNDVERYPLLTEKLEIPATEFIAGIVAWMDTTSPAYPPASDREGLQLRLNAFSRCLGTASLQKAYNTWLSINKSVATWADLERWIQQQLPTIDLVHKQFSAIVGHKQCAESTPSAIKAHTRSWLQALQVAGADTSGETPSSLMLPNRNSPEFQALDSVLVCIYLSHFSTQVREAYEERRQDDIRKFRQANPSAPIPRETLSSARATVETLSNISKWQRVASSGGGGHNGNRSQSTHREPRALPKSGATGCFHCGRSGHYAKDCHKLQQRLPNLPAADFDKLAKLGNARQIARQSAETAKQATKLNLAHIIWGSSNTPGHDLGQASAAHIEGRVKALDAEYEKAVQGLAKQ